jgi:hypothetical protein
MKNGLLHSQIIKDRIRFATNPFNGIFSIVFSSDGKWANK